LFEYSIKSFFPELFDYHLNIHFNNYINLGCLFIYARIVYFIIRIFRCNPTYYLLRQKLFKKKKKKKKKKEHRKSIIRTNSTF